MKESTTFNYEIKEHIGTISTSPKGWTTELNLVSWNGKAPKYDIRSWDPNHERMGKGVSLTGNELGELYALIGDVRASVLEGNI